MTDFGCIWLATSFCAGCHPLGSALVEGMNAISETYVELLLKQRVSRTR